MVDGVPAETIARAVGTPAYVYSAAAVRRRYRALGDAFASLSPLICYALKANPNRAVCAVLAKEGAGAEVVSGGELRRALAAGFRADQIVFSGVGKTPDELALAVRAGVLALNVESEEELSALARLARRLGRRAAVSIRVNPGVEAGGHRYLATGHGGAKFGVDPAQALMLCRRARRAPSLELRGLHCHIGSQILSPRPYAKALGVVLGLVERLAGQGVGLELLDLGGGMGVRYEDELDTGRSRHRMGPGARKAALDCAALARTVVAALRPWPRLRLVLEPGRTLTAEAGLLLTTVLYRKRVGSSRFIVVDAAMNDLARPALYDAYHPVAPARLSDAAEAVVDVVGPVCETGDVLARARRLPWLGAGEVLAVLKTGAYGFSMSSQYNSRLRAPEVLVEGGSWRLIRKRETFEDLVRHER